MTAEQIEIRFNNYVVPNLITYSADKVLRSSNISYNANGDMLVDMVSRKYLLTVYVGICNNEQYASLLSQTNTIFFPVTFFSASEGVVTRKFFMRKQPQKLKLFANDTPYYEAAVLQLEEQ